MFSPSQLRHTRVGGYPYYQSRLGATTVTGFPIKLGMAAIATPLEQP